MLQNRKFKLILLYLIMFLKNTEQSRKIQVQARNRGKKLPQSQIKQLDLQQMLQHERELKAQETLKYMNLQGEICKDFYDFACEKWLQKQKPIMARDGERVSVQSLMEEQVNKELQAVLIEPITSLDSMDSRVAKDYYIDCLIESATSPLQRQFMRSFILNYGGLPDVKNIKWPTGNYNWIYTIANLRRKYDMEILIGLSVDYNEDNQKVVYIEEPKSSLLPVELCSFMASRQLNENDKVFERYLNEIKQNLLNWLELTEANARRKARAILRFELDLCKFMRRNHVDIHYIKNISLHNLRHLSDCYLISFKDFVDISLENSSTHQVYFRNEEYFQQLKTLAHKDMESIFANYIMYRALYEINFPNNERPAQRPFYCVNKVIHYLPQVLGKLYNDKIHLEPIRQDIKEIFSIIKRAFNNYLEATVVCLTDNTKRLLNQTLKNLKLTFPSYPQNPDILKGLRLPNVFKDLPLKEEQNYWQKLQTIMMYKANKTIEKMNFKPEFETYAEDPPVSVQIKPAANELLVGYGILQKPFYSHLYSKALKYSSIGVEISREIFKMFEFHLFQKKYLNGFPGDPIVMNYLPRILECFQTQMKNYFYNKPLIYENGTKLYEIVLESSALNLAFNSYLEWLFISRTEADLQLETLPNLNFTNSQIFFINFAQSRCAGRYNVKLLPKTVPLFRRTMEEYNVNGPLIHSYEFGRDFSCPLGMPMNLDDKCLLH
ncbi:endothelin-converting enzyme homolog [Cochliomyia hominivorax]